MVSRNHTLCLENYGGKQLELVRRVAIGIVPEKSIRSYREFHPNRAPAHADTHKDDDMALKICEKRCQGDTILDEEEWKDELCLNNWDVHKLTDPPLTKFHYVVEVRASTKERADQVIAERVYFDEQYEDKDGEEFRYTIRVV